ncbi:MAG: hypothetical protein ACKVZH_06310 [Blastocatellia bacterium]
MKKLLCFFLVSFALTVSANAQRGNVDWMTDNADAQRSSWIRADGKISTEQIEKKKSDKPNAFQFLWKAKVKNAPKQLNNLMPPSTLDRLIGYRGFRMLGFFGGSSDNIITYDTDLGRLEWEKHLKTNTPASAGTWACPGGMTTGVAKPMLTAIPPSPTAAASGPGRSNPAKSAVGDAGQGAVTLANVRPNPPGGAAPNPMLVQQTRVNPANPPGGQLGAGPFLVYALASDGMLHSLHLSNGADYEAPTRFIPAGANASGLAIVDQVAYVVTSGACNGTDNGVWALDLISKRVSVWKGNVVGSAGPSFGGDGTLYVATGSGGDSPNSIVALEAKTLKLKASFSAGAEFATTPVLFSHGSKTLIAAATKDGKIHLLDAANLSAGALSSSASTGKELASGALASWQDRNGVRWILASIVGVLPAGFTGNVTKGAVVAWKLVEQGGKPTLQPGWASPDLTSPLTPTIINNVVFVTSSGEFRASDKTPAAMRAARSGKAVVYALDGATGKELWNSGTTITSFAHGGAISGGMGQIYLTTYDGTIYTFGFPMEH